MEIQHPRCPFCHTGVEPAHDKAACNRCMSWHHAGCWGEHGSCSACGGGARLGLIEAPGDWSLSVLDPSPQEARGAQEVQAAPRLRAPGARTRCPRCWIELTQRRYEGFVTQRCEGCTGEWLTPGACAGIAVRREVLFSDAERRAVLSQIYGPAQRRVTRGLPCPDCAAPLSSWLLQNLIAYRCTEHGVWLDAGDLTRIQILVEADPQSLEMVLVELGLDGREIPRR